MPVLQLGSIINGVVSNCLTALASSTVREYKVARATHRAIKAAARDCRFVNTQIVLTAWSAAVFDSNDLEKFRSNGAAAAIEKYREIAALSGSPSDEGTATEVIQSFLLHFDDLILTLAGHDERDEIRFRSLTSGIESLQAQGSEILSRLPTIGNPSFDNAVSTNAPYALIQALIDAGQFRVAREKLTAVSNSPNEGAEDAVTRLMLEGVCSYHYDDFADALEAFTAARRLNPKSGKIVSNIAAAYLALGKFENALREARSAVELAPEMPPANLIAALHAVGQDDEAIEIAQTDRWQSDADVLIACSRIFYDLGRWHDALEAARASTAIKPSLDAKELAAVILLSRNGMTRTRTPSRDITEAILILTECIADGRTADNPRQLHRLYVNRAAAQGLAGDYDRSLADAEAALQLFRTDEALAVKARACGAKHDWRQSVDLFAAIKDAALCQQTAPARAYALVQANREREGLDHALSQMVADAEDGDFLALAQIAILASRSLRDEEALAGVDSACAGRPDWVSAGVRGYRLLYAAQPERAVDELITAAAGAPPAERDVLALNSVRALLRIGRPRAAVKVCERFRDDPSDVLLAEAHASALYRCRDFSALKALCDELERAGTKSRSLRESRARLCEEAGDLRAAVEIYEALGNVDALLRAALLRSRLQQFDEVAALISRIDVNEVKDDPRNLMMLAALNDTLGRDPMALAYRALQIATGPEEVGEYVRLAGKWVAAPTSGTTVAHDSTVVLSGASRATVTISDEPLDEGLPMHVPTTSARGRRLVGKSVGDRTSLNWGGHSLDVVIESVSNKHHYALANAIETAPARFDRAAPVAPLPSAHIPSSPRHNELRRKYANQEISIGRLADLMGSAPTAVFNSTLLNHNARMHTFTGVDSEANAEHASLTNTSAIVLDVTSLLTLARLDLLDLLPVAFREVSVTQFVLDDLFLARQRVFAYRRDGIVRLARFGSGAQDSSAWDDFVAERVLLDRAIEFVARRCRVVACPAIITGSRRSLVAGAKVVGRVPLTSFLVARDNGATLVIDDIVSQRFAIRRHVRIASSHAILQVLTRRGFLSADKYGRALLKLREFDCQFLRVAVEDLYHFVEVRSDSDYSDFIQMASQLADSQADVRSVVAVASNLLVKIWISNLPDQSKVSATTATLILSALNRPPEVPTHIHGSVLTGLAFPWSRSLGGLSRNLRLFIDVYRDFEMSFRTGSGGRHLASTSRRGHRGRKTRGSATA